METNKVIIVYNTVQGKCIYKVWRFNPICLGLYKLDRVRAEIMEFFPSISKQRLEILLSYNDSLAGLVTLETDSDLQVANK